LDNSLTDLEGEVQKFIDAMVTAMLGMLTHIIGLVVSPVLAFYLLHNWDEMEEQLLHLLPGSWRQEICTIFRDIDKVLAGIIRGQLIIAVMVGILVSTGLYFLGVRYALLIGILAGILDVIPYFGAFIGAAPAVTVGLLESPILAAKAAVLFLIIHQLEGTIIGPRILGEKTGLNPLAVILVLFIGEECAGLVGMLLAVPLAAIGKVIIKHLAKALI
jgi:predicted PurR-regulated permease PerM